MVTEFELTIGVYAQDAKTAEAYASLLRNKKPEDEGVKQLEDTTVRGHLDSSGGALTVDTGHLDQADFTIELSYELAEQIFVDRDPQAIVPILLGGQIKLTGDSSKILGLAGAAAPPSPDTDEGRLAIEVVRRIDAITIHRSRD